MLSFRSLLAFSFSIAFFLVSFFLFSSFRSICDFNITSWKKKFIIRSKKQNRTNRQKIKNAINIKINFYFKKKKIYARIRTYIYKYKKRIRTGLNRYWSLLISVLQIGIQFLIRKYPTNNNSQKKNWKYFI